MIVSNEKEYLEVLDKAYTSEKVAVDIEGEPFNPEQRKDHAFQLELYGVGVYSEKVQAYIPAKFLDLQFQFVLDKVPVIMHNAKFDLTMLETYGFDVSKVTVHDTMILSWLLDENRRRHGLKDLAEKILRVQADKITHFSDVGGRPKIEDLGLFANEYDKKLEDWEKEMGKYCIDDCKHTFKLFELFYPKIVEQELEGAYLRVEIPLMKVLRKMERRGVKIDLEYLVGMAKEIDQKMIDLQIGIWKDAGKEFDINSPKQLGDILFRERGYTLPDDMRTPSGAMTTDSEALEYIAKEKQSTLASLVLDYRELAKLRSTYVEGLQKRHENGIIHTQYKQTVTVTGRLSSADPNLQNIPRRSDQFDIRKAFIPREGYVFVISDLSQIELRLLAYYSKDATLVKAFQDDQDIHKQTADALGCERVVAKAVNFGLAYGRSAYGLAKGMNMTPEAAEKFIEHYFSTFPGLKDFFEKAKNTMRKFNYVQTVTKRRRRFPEYAKAKREGDKKMMSRMERQTVNSIIQGSAADVMKIQMREIAKAIEPFDSHLLMQVHDEVIVEVPKEHAETVMAIVKERMENAITFPGVPIKTDPMIADRYKK